MGTDLGFEVLGLGLVAPEGDPNHEPFSSTRVRGALANGDVAVAARLLGRPHEVRGVVEHGDQRGRELGFPTANVAVPDEICLPADGIYAGEFRGHGRGLAPGRDLARPPPDLLRRRRALAARGLPARLRRRPLRPARAPSASSSGSGARSASTASRPWWSRWDKTSRPTRRLIGCLTRATARSARIWGSVVP